MKTTTTAKALYHVNEDLAGGTGFTGVCASSCFLFVISVAAPGATLVIGRGLQIQGFQGGVGDGTVRMRRG